MTTSRPGDRIASGQGSPAGGGWKHPQPVRFRLRELHWQPRHGWRGGPFDPGREDL